MTECPFKKHCQNPKTEAIKILGADPDNKLIKVCAKCPLLFSANKFKKLESQCLNCKITFEEIVTSQKVGCPYCYLFIKDLDKVVNSAQNNNVKHQGKKSKNLLFYFFQDIISKYEKENPESSKDCELLEKYIEDLF